MTSFSLKQILRKNFGPDLIMQTYSIAATPQIRSQLWTLYLQLYRLLYGDASITETRERTRTRRDADADNILPGFSDGLRKHLSNVLDFSGGTKTSLLTGAGRSLLDQILTAGHVPTDGIIYQLIRDNPKLLLNPAVRRLVMRMLEAAGRHEMESFMDTFDFNEVVSLLKVTCLTYTRCMIKKQSLRKNSVSPEL